jgi:hypothetical protein
VIVHPFAIHVEHCRLLEELRQQVARLRMELQIAPSREVADELDVAAERLRRLELGERAA